MKILFIILGWLSFGLGVVGAFLPVMPTVPFMILAAFFFQKGSPRLHAWILSLPKIGPAIEEWGTNRVIRPRAKLVACTMIVAGMSYPLLFNERIPLAGKIAMALTGVCLILFIGTRKSSATQNTTDTR